MWEELKDWSLIWVLKVAAVATAVDLLIDKVIGS